MQETYKELQVVQAFLLNDSLMIAAHNRRRRGPVRYRFQALYELDNMAVVEVKDSDSIKNAFKILMFPDSHLYHVRSSLPPAPQPIYMYIHVHVHAHVYMYVCVAYSCCTMYVCICVECKQHLCTLQFLFMAYTCMCVCLLVSVHRQRLPPGSRRGWSYWKTLNRNTRSPEMLCEEK